MWRVYRLSRNDDDYTNYKEALDAATNEIRQSTRSYEQKSARNIKRERKRLYACIRSRPKRTRQSWTTRRQCRKYNITRFFNGGRFLIYSNDLDDNITSNVLKYADDPNAFRRVNNDGDKQHLQNQEMADVVQF